jgi:hypothetical protein
VPRIGDQYLDCAVYVYRSLSDARAGERQGGSGFVIAVPLETKPEYSWSYIVTNQHVVRGAGNPVIRINRKDGKTDCFETNSTDWTAHPHGDDVAVMFFELDPNVMATRNIPTSIFLTEQLVADEDVGVGDNVFMVGRFINHEGRQQNKPSVRFGNISMMPGERIESPHGIEQDSFLIEARSLPGYSGSAVFFIFDEHDE